MNDPKRAEIRRVLLGRAVLAEDGRLAALSAGTLMKTPIGVGDGAGAVGIFGVTRRIRRYGTKDGKARVSAAAAKAMQNVGRGLILNEQPEALACLIRYVLTRPVVLTFDYEGGAPMLTAWTGRGLTAWFAMNRAIKAFERGLPDTMVPGDYKPPKPVKEKKEKKEKPKREKKPKKQKKQEKTEQPEGQPEQPDSEAQN